MRSVLHHSHEVSILNINTEECRDILSESSRFDLLEFLNKDRKTLFAFDFDGTLAAIIDEPKAAVMAPSAFKKLDEFAKRTKVVVLTGRSIVDVRPRLPESISVVVGSHGLEGHSLVSGSVLEGAFLSTRKWLDSLKNITQKHRKSRLWIEDKNYSLSVHYREVKSSPQFASLIAEIRSLIPNAKLVLGKRVINLIPDGMPNKLDALRDLMKSFSSETAFFIGDDVTDEVVFMDKSPDIFSVKVGFDSVLSAPYYLHKQDDIEILLDFFLAVVDGC